MFIFLSIFPRICLFIYLSLSRIYISSNNFLNFTHFKCSFSKLRSTSGTNIYLINKNNANRFCAIVHVTNGSPSIKEKRSKSGLNKKNRSNERRKKATRNTLRICFIRNYAFCDIMRNT